MEDLIKEYKPNANKKYYLLMGNYIDRLINDFDAIFRINVNEIVKGIPITRPTFYSYFKDTGDFYKELVSIYFLILPSYLAKLSKELDSEDYLQIIFKLRVGIALHNLHKISGNFSFLNPMLKEYYRKSNNEISKWYNREFDMDSETAKEKARIVVNELILNGDLYYRNFGTYKALMLDQKMTPIK